MLTNLPNSKGLPNTNGDSAYLSILLGMFFAFTPVEASVVLQAISSIQNMEANRTAGCCYHFCCVVPQSATKRMADQAKEESKMKIKIVSKPFDRYSYMSPGAAGGGGGGGGGGCCCCSHCCCTCCSHCCCSAVLL